MSPLAPVRNPWGRRGRPLADGDLDTALAFARGERSAKDCMPHCGLGSQHGVTMWAQNVIWISLRSGAIAAVRT